MKLEAKNQFSQQKRQRTSTGGGPQSTELAQLSSTLIETFPTLTHELQNANDNDRDSEKGESEPDNSSLLEFLDNHINRTEVINQSPAFPSTSTKDSQSNRSSKCEVGPVRKRKRLDPPSSECTEDFESLRKRMLIKEHEARMEVLLIQKQNAQLEQEILQLKKSKILKELSALNNNPAQISNSTYTFPMNQSLQDQQSASQWLSSSASFPTPSLVSIDALLAGAAASTGFAGFGTT